MSYAFPPGGLPDQSVDPEGTAIFTEAYAVLPAVTQRDIVTSFLPGWQNTRVWVLARPLSGFAETFAQYAVELGPEGGSATPEPDKDAQAVIFVARGSARLTLGQETFDLRPGSYAYIPPSAVWTLWNVSAAPCCFHWIRKRFQPAEGITAPEAMVTHESEVPAVPMPDCDGVWATAAVFRSARSALRFPRQYRHLPARRAYSLRRNPCDGARSLRACRAPPSTS